VVQGSRNLIAIAAACFIGFMGFTLVMPFLPLYLAELGVTDVGELALWSGLSLGITPAVTAILAPLWGRVADRFGAKVLLVRSLVSFVVIMTATGFATKPWHILALRAIQGFFAGYGALALAMAAESAPPARLASAIATVQTAQRLGPAIGPVIGGLLAPVVGLRRAFFVSASFYAVGLALVLWLYREPARERGGAREDGEGRVTFRSVLAFEHFLLLVGAIFAMQLVDRSLGPILPLYVSSLGYPPSRVAIVSGVLFSIIAAAAAAGHHVSGPLLKRYAPRVVICTSVLAGCLAVLLLAVVHRLPALVCLASVFGLAIGASMTACYATVGGLLPAETRGTGFGFLTSASLAALSISPMLSGFIAARRLSLVFVADAVLLGTVGIVVWRWLTAAHPPWATRLPAEGTAPVMDEE
jgi:DHA1 family multidrug resistance protein-like MFS transporter